MNSRHLALMTAIAALIPSTAAAQSADSNLTCRLDVAGGSLDPRSAIDLSTDQARDFGAGQVVCFSFSSKSYTVSYTLRMQSNDATGWRNVDPALCGGEVTGTAEAVDGLAVGSVPRTLCDYTGVGGASYLGEDHRAELTVTTDLDADVRTGHSAEWHMAAA